MKTISTLAASLVLAFATAASAQDASKPASDSTPASASKSKPAAAKHHAFHHLAANRAFKIDHSDDRLVVKPRDNKVTIPAGQG